MKVIQFEKDKEFSKSLKSKVTNYFTENNISIKGNSKMYVKTIIMISMYVLPFIALLTLKVPILLAILSVIIMGVGVAGIGMNVMHDAAHGSYSHKRWVNTLFASSMYLLGSNVLNWKIQHNIMHHTFTNVYNYDEDIDTGGPIRLSKVSKLRKVHKFQYIYIFLLYGLMTISKFFNEFGQLLKYNKEGVTKGQGVNPTLELLLMVLRKSIYLLVLFGLPLYFTDYSFLTILGGFFIMHWVSGFLMATTFVLAHVVENTDNPTPNDDGKLESEFMIHQLHTTTNFARDSKFLSWFVGGLNFQVEHHLFPNICHVHYKKLSSIVEETAKDFGVPYKNFNTLSEALLSHVNHLKLLGRS